MWTASYVDRLLCGPCPMRNGSSVDRALCGKGPMWTASYVDRILCGQLIHDGVTRPSMSPVDCIRCGCAGPVSRSVCVGDTSATNHAVNRAEMLEELPGSVICETNRGVRTAPRVRAEVSLYGVSADCLVLDGPRSVSVGETTAKVQDKPTRLFLFKAEVVRASSMTATSVTFAHDGRVFLLDRARGGRRRADHRRVFAGYCVDARGCGVPV